MNIVKDFEFEGMTEAVEFGAGLAWRLLATLEGGSIIIAASALLAYTARNRLSIRTDQRPIRTVLVTNTNESLGRELKTKFELCGCTVTSGAGSGRRVDALVVVGAEPKTEGLDGLTGLVTEDVYNNIKLLESFSPLVKEGGYIAWACAGAEASATRGAFAAAERAFDSVLQTTLQHTAKLVHCEPVWIGRGESPQRTADILVATILKDTNRNSHTSRYSVRNAANIVSQRVGRWLKIAT
ncbi:uncharacterized protein LOC101741240 [Bombyx mori]|uniref:Uncharacterized protein n=2 Tax=Bombyx mori TaxID=7091 RepID=A0A8R1WIV6_BOMMO|nr:uncharacterized protein LOC101741240 isoform X1 [Bombyx mori]